jgi:hypothetical protein
MHGSSASTPGRVALGDAVPATVFPGAVDPGVARLGLPGSPSLLPLHIN